MASTEYALPFKWDEIDVYSSGLELVLGSGKADWDSCFNVGALMIYIVWTRARSDNGAGSKHSLVPRKLANINRINLRERLHSRLAVHAISTGVALRSDYAFYATSSCYAAAYAVVSTVNPKKRAE